MKILITGNAGSGKTTFSKKLASKLQVNAYSLDSIVWKPGWQETPSNERREKIQKLIDGNSWIVDGVSSQVFLAADVIYFLDIPLHICIKNILVRFLTNGLKTRESLPENCPEYLGVFKAIKITFVYQKKTRPIIIDLINEHKEKKIIWVKSYNQISCNFSNTN